MFVESKGKENTMRAYIEVLGKRIEFDEFLRKVDEYLHSRSPNMLQITEKIKLAMNAKIPIRFYSMKELQRLNLDDMYGFAIAFTISGYAVAKVSQKILGAEEYAKAVSVEARHSLLNLKFDEEIPISFNEEIIAKGNVIPWDFIYEVLTYMIERNYARFAEKFPWASRIMEKLCENIINEFLLTGYFIGLWENVKFA